VHEQIVTTIVAADEAKTLGIVEPLHSTGFLGHVYYSMERGKAA
jgi:hypothetical protein